MSLTTVDTYEPCPLLLVRTVEIWLAPTSLQAPEGMDHASYINKLALSNSD